MVFPHSPYSILSAAIQSHHYKVFPVSHVRTSCCEWSHWLLILATKRRPFLSNVLPFLDLKTLPFSMSSLSWSTLFRLLQVFLAGHIFLTSCNYLSSLQPFHCFLKAQCTKLDGCTFQGLHRAVGTSCVLQTQLLFKLVGQLVLVSQHHDVAHLCLPMIHCHPNFPCRTAVQPETLCPVFSS